jgi:hypothetical protein
MQRLRLLVGLALVGVGVAGDQRVALRAGVEVEPLQHLPDAVLGDSDPAPLLAPKLGRDPSRAEARVAEREGEDPVLEVRADLVRHPRATALSDPEAVEAVALELLLPDV